MPSSPIKAYAYPVEGHEAEIDTLKKLIVAGGCELVCPDEPAAQFERCVEMSDVVVELICPETMNNEVIDRALAFAVRSGKRVVGVWASDTLPDRLPRFLHRHGFSAIGMIPDKIAEAVCGERPIWDSPGGGPRPKPPTPRHKGH